MAGADQDDDGEADEDSGGGGASGLGVVAQKYKQIPPSTRGYLTTVLLVSLVDVVAGQVIDSASAFALDWTRVFKSLELWRPVTGSTYLGPLSMSWASNLYFLTMHASALEQVNGTADHLIFLIFTVTILTVLGPLLGMPYVATSVISAHTYAASRLDPMMPVSFQFLRLPAWVLPYAQMGADMLQAQSVAAGIPHLLGIFTGHIYHFFSSVYPLMGGRALFKAPNWLKRRLDQDAAVPNYMASPEEAAAAAEAPPGRKIGSKATGRKVGTKKP